MLKNLLGTLIIAFFAISISFGQDCAGLTLKAGSGFEMNSFDGKGKPAGTMTYKITDVKSEDGGIVFTIAFEMFNTKGKSEAKNTYSMKCTGNTLIMDARSLISEEQLKSFKDTQMKFTSKDIELPNNMTVGQQLKDAALEGVGVSGPMTITFTMNIVNRKVEKKESITVPAGTFDAFKINSDINMETKMGFGMKMEMQSISYRAPGVIWDIKTETYRKGKLMGSTELTKIY